MIKSTLISGKSSGVRTTSSAGVSQSISHTALPTHPVNAPKGNPGKHAIKPELPYDTKQGTKEASSVGVAHGSFKGQCARTETIVKHPNKKNDPVACKY